MKDGDLTNTFNYVYDKIGQLTEVKKNNSTIESYSYDSNGNRLNNNAQYDSQDRLISNSSTTFGYTERGTLLTRTENNQTTSYNYDLMGNLLSVSLPNSTNIEYITDARNRRIAKKVNGIVTQKFLYLNQLEPIAELDSNDNIISLFIYGTRSNTPDYIIKNNVKYKVVTNQLGSVVKVVNVSSGEIVQSIEYDSFGNILSDSNPNFQPFRLAGGLYDVDTKLTRFGARDYDAREGRWISKDPIKFDGGMNFYVYSGNNAVNFVDVTGLMEKIASRTLTEKITDEEYNKMIDELAFEAMKSIMCDSVRYNKEGGFRIDKVGNELIAYKGDDIVESLGQDKVNITLEEGKSVASGHFHQDCDMAKGFSGDDKKSNAKDNKIKGYVASYLGTVRGDFKSQRGNSDVLLPQKFDLSSCKCKKGDKVRSKLGEYKNMSCEETLKSKTTCKD